MVPWGNRPGTSLPTFCGSYVFQAISFPHCFGIDITLSFFASSALISCGGGGTGDIRSSAYLPPEVLEIPMPSSFSACWENVTPISQCPVLILVPPENQWLQVC